MSSTAGKNELVPACEDTHKHVHICVSMLLHANVDGEGNGHMPIY